MKNFLLILDPDEEERDYDKSLEGIIGDLADEAGNSDFKHWKKYSSRSIRETDSFNLIHEIADAVSDFHLMVKSRYGTIGFMVGMAYADLVSERNHETKEILDRIKRKLKKSGFLPKEGKAAHPHHTPSKPLPTRSQRGHRGPGKGLI